MKPLCAKCKVPLERSPENGALACPSCGDALHPVSGSENGFGACPSCSRELEYDAALGVRFCPACDEALRPRVPPPARRSPRADVGPPVEKATAASPPAPEEAPAVRARPAPPVPEAAAKESANAEEGEDEGAAGLDTRTHPAVHSEGECQVLTFHGRVGEREYDEFKTAVRRGVESGALRLIVDLGMATYISSSGLSVLIWANGELAERGVRMIIVNVPQRTRKLLQIISVDHLLEFAGDVREAIERPDRGAAE